MLKKETAEAEAYCLHGWLEYVDRMGVEGPRTVTCKVKLKAKKQVFKNFVHLRMCLFLTKPLRIRKMQSPIKTPTPTVHTLVMEADREGTYM